MVNKILLFGLLVISTTVFAQPTFLGGPANTTPASATSSSKSLISPSDFNSRVSQITSKRQAAFKEQLDKQLSQPQPAITTKQPTATTTTKVAPPAPPVNRDVYTGFGGGSAPSKSDTPNPDATSSPSTSSPTPIKSGGGWNIRY